MPQMTREGAFQIAAKAITRGGSMTRQTTVKWDAAKQCDNPRSVSVEGRSRPTHGRYTEVVPGTATQPLWVDIEVPCRKCPGCLRARQLEWTRRAVAECAASARTWFGTLTLTPSAQAYTRLKARSLRSDFDRCDADQQFRLVCRALGRAVTLWLKRVRKRSRARLRYLVVYERHKSGDPHVHVLLHEVSPLLPVRKALLETEWQLGFTSFKLAEPTTARYVCKYLAKEAVARVRASRFYGDVECEIPSLVRLSGRGS